MSDFAASPFYILRETVWLRGGILLFSIAVCDDVVLECADLAKRVENILEKKRVPALYRQFYTGKDLLNAKETFDIIFLDIRMPEISGMDLAKLLREKMSGNLLIFVTSFQEYVFEAYEVEAFRYLVKPIAQKKLDQVLEQAIEKLNSEKEDFLVVSSQRDTKKIWLKNI
ncbi:MAG: response regulator, partial [Lachnospiraceae bacterium]|nr:response regulator [Lachnospiraceae bacterium]